MDIFQHWISWCVTLTCTCFLFK